MYIILFEKSRLSIQFPHTISLSFKIIHFLQMYARVCASRATMVVNVAIRSVVKLRSPRVAVSLVLRGLEAVGGIRVNRVQLQIASSTRFSVHTAMAKQMAGEVRNILFAVTNKISRPQLVRFLC